MYLQVVIYSMLIDECDDREANFMQSISVIASCFGDDARIYFNFHCDSNSEIKPVCSSPSSLSSQHR